MSAGGDSIHVLHVDDDAALAETAARFLERADDRIEVTTATRPAAALERLEAAPVDCVVSDYDMPEMDGLELFEAVRERHPAVPFILFTGKGNEAVAGEAVTAGVTDYLQKSTDTEQYGLLANRITNAVESARTGRRLRAERRRFRELFEHFPEPTVAYVYEDGEPHIVDVNRAFTEVFGYDEARAVGEPVDDLIVPPDRREEAERIDERVQAGDSIDEHVSRRTADGIREFRFRNVELPDDEQVDGYGIYTDITERKEQLSTISELQDRAQRLIRAEDRERVAEVAVDIATDVLAVPFAGVYLRDDDGTTLAPIAVTDATAERLGTVPAIERTGSGRTIDRMVWGTFQAGEPTVIEDLAANDAVDEDETPSRSGVVFPLGDQGVFAAASPDRAALSETDRYLADILATVLTAALDRADRERVLRTQKDLLQARTDRLDELVSVISHDLQSPLNVADGRLDLARAECDSRHLEDAASAVDRSRAIVADLLALAREGDRDDDPTPVTLASIVEDCWVSVVSGDATLAVETDSVLLADRGRLRHLLENLFRNAVEHGPPAGDGPVTVTVGDLDDGFYVADDGVGIPPAEREDVFESGYSSGDGTGLGLSIVQQVAREHGWDLTLTESESGGARFEVTGVDRPAG